MILLTYNLFISSTFKDMDVERDVIKYDVIPALNQMFNKKGVEIHAIDLRYGVNTSGMTEAEASDKVLNMCVQSIDRARPFFVGFIGNRYGWQPSPQRWIDFYARLNSNQQEALKDSINMSITEMEIVYSGFFSQDASHSRYLFCMRDDFQEEAVPASYRPNFTKEEPEKQVKISKLRDKIKKRCDELSYGQCFSYQLSVTDSTITAPGLADKLVKEIADMINKEIQNDIPIPNKVPKWAAEINESTMYFRNLAQQSVSRPDIERAMEEVETGVLISGPSFSGRSTMLARMYWKYFVRDWENQTDKHRKILLTARINSSQYSRNIHQIMGRWVVEMYMLLGIEQEDGLKNALIEAAPVNHNIIQEMFFDGVDIIRSAGHTVHIFIDDLDQFMLSSPGDEMLDWVDERVKVYATCNSDTLKFLGSLPFWVIGLMDVIDDSHHILLNTVKQQNFCELPEEINNVFSGDARLHLLDTYEKQPEYIMKHLCETEFTFLQLNTMFKMVRLLNGDDFKEMRTGDALEGTKVKMLFESLPQDYEKLLDYFVNFYTNRKGSKSQYKNLIQLLRDTPQGLRVEEIIERLNDGLCAPDIYSMLYYFSDFVSIEYDTEIVKLRHHPQLFGSHLYLLSKRRLKEIIFQKASLFLIPEAMRFCCTLVGVEEPTTFAATRELIANNPEAFDANNITSFVINAYLLTICQNQGDVRGAEYYADKALRIANSIGEEMDVCRGHIYWAQAVLFRAVDSDQQARENGVSALNIFEEKQIVYSDLPDLYLLVGQIYEKEGQTMEAARYYKGALRILKLANKQETPEMKTLTLHIQELVN